MGTFIIGIFVGAFLGFLLAALCSVAKNNVLEELTNEIK